MLLNAASVFMISGKAKDFREGIELASKTIDSGKAIETLEKVIQFTHTEKRFLRGGDFISAEMT